MPDKIREYLSARTGGETPGDTLIRLSKYIVKVYHPNGDVNKASSKEWCAWLEEIGQRLNEALTESSES